MADEQSQVVDTQSANASAATSVQESASATTEPPLSQSQDTNASAPAAPAATGEPAPAPAEPVHKEPPKEPVQPPTQPEKTRQSHGYDIKERKSTHRNYTTRSTKDFRAFSRAGYMSMMSIKRGSLASFQDRQKQPKFMNTYKLNSEKPFNPDKVKSIIVKIVEENITDDMIYDQDLCPDKAKHISATIRQRVKEQEFDRYKLVCIVTIGEKKSHDILTAVRFLWDSERDRFATYFYENMYLFAVASVFGVYYE